MNLTYEPVPLLEINADVLRVIVLFLEKYEILSEQDRDSISLFVKCAANPPLLYKKCEGKDETT